MAPSTPSPRLPFASDYTQGTHPAILERLVATNLDPADGYGMDERCERARALIRAACDAPDAEVHFLVGGTQTNAVVIDTLLRPWQGVVAAESGHIATHEAGAIEACGHKVLTLPAHEGKLRADELDAYVTSWAADENRDHTVMPGVVYLSQPTEYGTLYSNAELAALRATCDKHDMALYVDGARLAYALGAPTNDVSLADFARLTDAFYIGGTKCGALFGEAVVFGRAGTCPHFFTLVKRRGALLAKGFLYGLQFGTLFESGLYQQIGTDAVAQAARIAQALKGAGCELALPQVTNQVFPILDDQQLEAISSRVDMGFWEKTDDGRTIMRLATSWATTDAEIDTFEVIVRSL